jgi:hypothetical protein
MKAETYWDAYDRYLSLFRKRKGWVLRANYRITQRMEDPKPYSPGTYVKAPLNATMSVRKPGKMVRLSSLVSHLHQKLHN